jgi:hypothetical protein
MMRKKDRMRGRRGKDRTDEQCVGTTGGRSRAEGGWCDEEGEETGVKEEHGGQHREARAACKETEGGRKRAGKRERESEREREEGGRDKRERRGRQDESRAIGRKEKLEEKGGRTMQTLGGASRLTHPQE